MSKKKLITGLASAALLTGIMLPMAAGALSSSDLGLYYGGYTGLTGTDIRITIANIVKTAMGLLGIIAVLIVLYGGFMWMTAAGNEDRVGEAKKILIAGIIGLVIIITAYAIASFIVGSLIQASS